jgi:hypothetical protein
MTLHRRFVSRFATWLCSAIVGAAAAVSMLTMALAARAQDQGVVLVVDHVGQVSVANQGAARPIATLSVLPIGSRVQLDPAATLTLLYVSSGDEYRLTGPGAALVDASGVTVTAAEAATVQRRAPSNAKPVKLRSDALAMGGVVMRSGGLRARYPAGVLIAQPSRLVWDSLTPNAPYRVEMRDAAGTVLFTQAAQGLTMAFPEGVQLRPEERYTWTVAPDNAAAPVSRGVPATATFSLAAQDLRDEAQRLSPDNNATFSDRLIYGLWLEQMGALGEARQLWQQLADQRPDDDALIARARK